MFLFYDFCHSNDLEPQRNSYMTINSYFSNNVMIVAEMRTSRFLLFSVNVFYCSLRKLIKWKIERTEKKEFCIRIYCLSLTETITQQMASHERGRVRKMCCTAHWSHVINNSLKAFITVGIERRHIHMALGKCHISSIEIYECVSIECHYSRAHSSAL